MRTEFIRFQRDMGAGTIAGLATGLIGGIGGLFARGKANRDLKNLEGQDPSYTANPLAKQRTDLAGTILNSQMPGTAQQEQAIGTNESNAFSNVERNATDSGTALAMGNAEQGVANNAEAGLTGQQAAWKQFGINNYNSALAGQISEGDKVFGDQERRYGDKVQIQGKINENRAKSWSDISNLGFGAADLGLQIDKQNNA